MSYRPQLSSMDKDTILFVRKNRMALAYHWDFYSKALAMVSKEFITDPPVAVYYKVTDDVSSWVHVNLSQFDGLYALKFTIPEAARYSYDHGARLVSDMGVNIPNAIYVDADGYEYTIALNDGTEEYVLRNKLTVGKPTSDVGLTQHSISNLNLAFSQRHLMDDVKLTFRNGKVPLNSLVTFNSLIHPYHLDINDSTVAYIRNALRMSTYTSYDSDYTKPAIPLRVKIVTDPIIAPVSGAGDFVAKTMINSSGTMIRVLANGSVYRSLNRGLSWEVCIIPAFDISDPIVATGDVKNSTNAVNVVPFPGSENGWFAYSSDTIGKETANLRYAVSHDNGITWDAISYTAIGATCERIVVLPYITNALIIKADVNADDPLILESTNNGLSWVTANIVGAIPPNDVPYNLAEDLDMMLQTQTFTGSNHYVSRIVNTTTQEITYRVYRRLPDGGWMNSFVYKVDDIPNLLKLKLGATTITGLRYSFHYDADSDVLHLVFSAHATDIDGIAANDFDISGQMMTTDDGSTWQLIYTTKTYAQLMSESQSLSDITDPPHGEHVVKFDTDVVLHHMGRWIIFDTLNSGGRFRVSEDFLTWFPVEGLPCGNDTINPISVNKYDRLICDDTHVYFTTDGGEETFIYTIPSTRIHHYDMRTKIYKWVGVKMSQQIRAEYMVWDDELSSIDNAYKGLDGETSTNRKPLRIGFSFDINPNAFMLMYNGLPILNDSAYVNPENPREIIVENMQLYKALQMYINPVQFIKNKRDYIYADFSVINFTAEDPTKDCFMYCDRGHILNYAGKECHVNFHSDLAGDFILFNGVDHEYIITGKKSIKYIISRYGLHEAVYPGMPYMHIGVYNIRHDIKRDVYKIQFILKPKT